MTTSGRRRSGGFALVAVLMLMVLLLGMGAAMHSGIMSDTVQTGAHRIATEGFYAAEAGVNRGMGDYKNIFLSQNVPTAADFAPHSFTLGPRRISYSMSPVAGYTNGVPVIVPGGRTFAGLNATEYRYTTNSRSELRTGDVEVQLGTEFNVDFIPLFQFLAFYQGDLEILPGPNMNLHGPIHTNGSLYLNAGNTFTIADCYPATCPTAIPTVHIAAARDIYRGRKDAPTGQCTGTVRISKLADANRDGLLDTRDMPCVGTNTAQQTTAQMSQWLGAITSRVPPVAVPTPDDFVYGNGKNWFAADLRIVLDLEHPDTNLRFAIFAAAADGSVDVAQTARLQAFMNAKPGRLFYNDIPVANRDQLLACNQGNSYCNQANYVPTFPTAARVYACAGSDNNTPPLAGCANGYITNDNLTSGTLLAVNSRTARRGGFYNNREHAWIYMLNLNAHDLLAWNMAQGAGNQFFDPLDQSDGGLVIFMGVKGPGANPPAIPTGSPARRYGVRVFGSDHLDFPANPANPTGLTVTSDQGIYVEGNYNVGVAGFPKMPASFMGDTINVLSASWSGTANNKNDWQSRQSLADASRSAGTATTIYAAYIGGVNVTTVGNYNGGFENYPRFHENWATTYTYRGSYVNLGTARHNNGDWCGTGGTSAGGCNIYNPPTRNWDFDTDFMNSALLPPLTPNAVGVEQILFTESFR